LLDDKKNLLENLDLIKRYYLKLIIIKQLEEEAFLKSSYYALHEFTENERVIIEDINSTLKYIVPDLVLYRSEPEVKEKLAGLEELQTSIISRSLGLKQDLEEKIRFTRKKLKSLDVFPSSASQTVPRIVNIRA